MLKDKLKSLISEYNIRIHGLFGSERVDDFLHFAKKHGIIIVDIDNISGCLTEPAYIKYLKALSETERQRLVLGSWDTEKVE